MFRACIKGIAYLLSILFCISLNADGKSIFSTSGVAKSLIIKNVGQVRDQYGNTRPDVLFVYNATGFQLQIRKTGFSYELFEQVNENKGLINSHRVDVEFVDALVYTTIYSDYVFPSTKETGYYIPEEGRTLLAPCVERVILNDVWQGINIVFSLNRHGNEGIKYDFVLNKSASIEDIKLRFSGHEGINLYENESLKIATSLGEIEEKFPVISLRRDKSSSTNIFFDKQDKVKLHLDGNELTFSTELEDYYELVIDPQIIWGTYYGSTSGDYSGDVAVDVRGDIIFTGHTQSRDNIATSGGYRNTFAGSTDAFIVKLNSNGVRQWGTYFGGPQSEQNINLVLDRTGNIIIGGTTRSKSGVSTTGAFRDENLASEATAFIAKFTNDGDLLWSTYFGGEKHASITGVATDGNNNIYIAGSTESTSDIATSNAFQESPNNSFIAKFNSDGDRLWGTYFGQNGELTTIKSIDAKNDGTIAIAGSTIGRNGISTAGAHQEQLAGSDDGFIVLFDSDGRRLWGTFYGGLLMDDIQSVKFVPGGDILVSGSTASSEGIATPGAFREAITGVIDAFFAKFNASGELVFGTYFGGTNSTNESATGITAGANGDILVTGLTQSSLGISTPGSHQEIHGGNFDKFIARFTPSGERIWSSYYGGQSWEYSGFDVSDPYRQIAVDGRDNIIICGETGSNDGISTAGSHQHDYAGATDCFVAKLAPFPENLVTGSTGTEYCAGEDVSVPYTALSDFQSGNVFTAQISDENGSFGNPEIIGSITSTNSGIINAVLPKELPPGSAYRIRVVSSKPNVNGLDNGEDITINELPKLILDGKTDVCEGSAETYLFNSEPGIKTTPRVEGGTFEIMGSQIAVTWGNAGNGKISLVQEYIQTGCKDSITLDVVINELPFAEIIATEQYCAGEEIIIEAIASDNYKLEWQFPGSDSVNLTSLNEPALIFNSPGVYTITLTVTDTITFCTHAIEHEINILPVPLASIEGNITVCTGESYTYLSEFPESGIKWQIENGNIIGADYQPEVNVLWDNPGIGKVKLIQVNESNCMDSIEIEVNILDKPFPEFKYEAEICEGDIKTYVSTPFPGVISNWRVDGGIIQGSSDSSVVTIEWGAEGVGAIVLEQKIGKGNCSDSMRGLINIHPKPVAKIIGEDNVGAGIPYKYKSGNKENSLKWVTKGGNIIGSDNLDSVFVVWTETDATLILTVSNGTCSDSALFELQPYFFPDAEIKTPGELCTGIEELFSAGVGFINQWYSEGALIDVLNDTEALISWATPGIKELMLIRSHPDINARDTSYREITVNPAPDTEISGESESCGGCTEAYQANPGDFENTWNVAGGQIINNTGSEISVLWDFDEEGRVILEQRDTLSGCINKDEYAVILSGFANRLIGEDFVCTGQTYMYELAGEVNMPQWEVIGGEHAGVVNEKIAVIIWNVPGTGRLTASYEDKKGKLHRDTLNIKINETPNAQIEGFAKVNRFVSEEYRAGFTLLQNVSYRWSVEGGVIPGSNDAQSITVNWGPPGTGKLKLVVTDNNTACSDTALINVQIIDSDANAVLSIRDAEAEPGEYVSVPIELLSSRFIEDSGIKYFDGEIVMNATTLVPTGNTGFGRVENGVRYIPLTLPVSAEKGQILGNLEFIATLGNTRTSVIRFGKLEPIGAVGVVNAYSGSFELKDLCEEGGTRLVIDSPLLKLQQSYPNPADETVYIEFSISEPGMTELTVINTIGEKVLVLENKNKKPGSYIVQADVSELPSGSYIYVLKTPTQVLSGAMKVLH